MEKAKETLKKYDPEIIEKNIREGRIEKWRIELIGALTELYDRSHADALGQKERFMKKK